MLLCIEAYRPEELILEKPPSTGKSQKQKNLNYLKKITKGKAEKNKSGVGSSAIEDSTTKEDKDIINEPYT